LLASCPPRCLPAQIVCLLRFCVVAVETKPALDFVANGRPSPGCDPVVEVELAFLLSRYTRIRALEVVEQSRHGSVD
jgi:hypothetical protein